MDRFCLRARLPPEALSIEPAPAPGNVPPNGQTGTQHELEMIAQRTKDALQAAKARGVVLGNPKLDAVRDRAVASVKADADRFARNVAPIIREIKSTGVASHRGIARSLNARGVATARGGQWNGCASWLDLEAREMRRDRSDTMTDQKKIIDDDLDAWGE
jgi:hypothetical protein